MLTLLLLSVVKPADSPVDRFQNYMKGVKDLSVSLRMTVDKDPSVGTGFLRVNRPKHFVYRMKWSGHDYSFSINGPDALAIERSTKVYREYPGGGFFIPEADISPVPDYGFPVALMAGSLRAMAPGGVQFKAEGKKDVDGVAVDQVTANWAIQFGSITLRAWIDAAGRLVGYERIVVGPNANTVRMKIANYRINASPPASDFATPIPLGFVPETLPPDNYPLNVGERVPMKSWKPLTGNKSLASMTAKKIAFYAIGDPNCEVSRRSAATIQNLTKRVVAKGGTAVALSVDRSAKQTAVYRGLSTFFDPTGHGADDLRTPGTPMFLLTAANGRVTRIWYGFNVAKAAEFTADVLAWVEISKKPDTYFKYIDGG